MSFPDDIVRIATGRLVKTVPGVSGIVFYPAGVSFLSISFVLGTVNHQFRLRREAGLWDLREWLVNGSPQDVSSTQRSPRFESLIASVLRLDEHPPSVEIVELRCPDDPRRLFAKLVLQHPDSTAAKSLIEVSCQQCKRKTGLVTKHYWSFDGSLVKTESHEPWVKREPGPWFSKGNGNRTRAPVPSA